MKKLSLAILLVIFCFQVTKAQWKVSTQIGGANFLGASLNAAYSIPFKTESVSSLEFSGGFGVLLPAHGNNSNINTHINYIRKSWGLGVETAFYRKAPFFNESDCDSFVDILVYPNLNYTFRILQDFYLNASAGMYLAWERSGTGILENQELKFAGDPIPGAGLTFGYIF